MPAAGSAFKMLTLVQDQQIESEKLRIKFALAAQTQEQQQFAAAQNYLQKDKAAQNILNAKILQLVEQQDMIQRTLEILNTRKELTDELGQESQKLFDTGKQLLAT